MAIGVVAAFVAALLLVLGQTLMGRRVPDALAGTPPRHQKWAPSRNPYARSPLVNPAELGAEFHQLRELAPAFAVRTVRPSIERAAKETIDCGDADTRKLAEQLLEEVGTQRSFRDPRSDLSLG
jgi:hypothetical protein